MSEGSDLVQNITELSDLDGDIHWFCGRREGVTSKESLPVDVARRHHRLALDSLMIFSFDGSDAEIPQKLLTSGIDRDLRRCEFCIIEFYKGKAGVFDGLREDGFEEDQIEQFAGIFDEHAVTRIKHGLRSAKQKLQGLAAPGRKLSILDRSALMALYEALCCDAFLNDDTALENSFRSPFELSQAQERLSPPFLTPAHVKLLFSSDQFYRNWATSGWKALKGISDLDGFNRAVKRRLSSTLAKVAAGIQNNGYSDLDYFWRGMHIILSNLSSSLITNGLRDMEVDICRLVLENLHLDNEQFTQLLQAFKVILEKSSKDFWDAMGPIAPSIIIEQVFNNPAMNNLVDEGSSLHIEDALCWVEPFIASLRAGNQPPACRSFANQLLQKLQNNKYPEHIRSASYGAGVQTFTWIAQNCIRSMLCSDAVNRAVVKDLMTLVNDHIETFVSIASASTDNQGHQSLASICCEAVSAILALELKCLKADQECLLRKQSLPNQTLSSDLRVWKLVLGKLNRRTTALTIATVDVLRHGLNVGKVRIKDNEGLAKEKSAYNERLGELFQYATQALERLGDVGQSLLPDLLLKGNLHVPLLTALYMADSDIHSAAADALKTAFDKQDDIEALRELFDRNLKRNCRTVTKCLSEITTSLSFVSCPRMLKTSSDVMNALCNSQDGVLRLKELSDEDVNLLNELWRQQWQCLKVVYTFTEKWSLDREKDMMQEFCRDTMQFSKYLFEQYTVFANAVTWTPYDDNQKMADQDGTAELLRYPQNTLESIVNWLRLRDEYLAATSVDLIKSIVGKLRGSEVDLSTTTEEFLEKVAIGKTRTILTNNQKAELIQVLVELNEKYAQTAEQFTAAIGDKSKVLSKDASTKQALPHRDAQGKDSKGGLDSWLSNRQGVDGMSAFSAAKQHKDDLHGISPAFDKFRQLEAQRQQQRAQQREAVKKKEAERKTQDQDSFRKQREKERAERKARDIAASRKARGVADDDLTKTRPGSVLSELGLLGKDHKVEKSEMMVSDESESESSSDSDNDIDRELFGRMRKEDKSSSLVKEAAAERMKLVKPHAPVKKVRQNRSAKDMRARLTPDLSNLHKFILAWDIFQEGDLPPNGSKSDYSLVSPSFLSAHQYQTTFEPLLLLEAWQGLCQSKEEGLDKTFKVKVSSRLSIDSFFEISISLEHKELQEIGIIEADILLLTQNQVISGDKPNCLARVNKISRKRQLAEVALRVLPGNNKLLRLLSPNLDFYLTKIGSLTPLEREYGAMKGLQYYDLCEEIVSAVPSPILDYSQDKLDRVARMYDLNAAQARAVQSAIDNDAFTLVQGPPGSGKTKTIIAIVGALISNELKKAGTMPVHQPGQNCLPQAALRSDRAAKKLLVCAPSNAAVDELVMRLMDGIRVSTGETRKVSVIRLGRSDRINPKVQEVMLEELVNKQLNAIEKDSEKSLDEMGKAMAEHKLTCEKLNRLRGIFDDAKESGSQTTPEQSREFEILKRKRQSLSEYIDRLKDSGNSAARNAEIKRKQIQQQIIDGAHILCATLSGSGHDMFQGLQIDFETVIIDEAAQSVELSALIPLKYGCQKCIMVGDPKQLPPTVLSREAARYQYEQSLFVRMQMNRPKDVHLLDTQYRMHPEISQFPSKTFYDGRLLDGSEMAKLRRKPWHHDELLGPYRFFHVEGQHQTGTKGHSLMNRAEVDVAMALYQRLRDTCRNYDFKGKVGVITPYKSQLGELRRRFQREYGENITDTIEFNTTDAFQGRESEIIIFSCVRASSTGIGFLSDIRRMNVGITRAKCSLWVLGNSNSLIKGEYWKKLIDDAQTRKRYTAGDLMNRLQNDVKRFVEPPPISAIPDEVMVKKEDVRSTQPMDVDKPVKKESQEPPKPRPSLPITSRPVPLEKRKRQDSINSPTTEMIPARKAIKSDDESMSDDDDLEEGQIPKKEPMRPPGPTIRPPRPKRPVNPFIKRKR